jgi:aspartyl-tRNA(Asn)/glutamyl-tRNA(Gln) amidotransferase subunit A
MMPTIAEAAEALAEGRTTSRELVETALDRIAAPAGEGARVFTHVAAERARAEADHADRMRAAGHRASPIAGLPVTVKDLFDVAGETTTAGSKVLRGAPPASADAPVVARLRAAGAVILGRTNMTEFAYSGLGINPHYGTARGIWDRATGRVPGGSSSGAGVSVADGMAIAALGTDTGGSVRIPAAANGIAGFKPTQRRVPLDGTLPLSPSLDSTGPLARTVACCAVLDAILAGAPARVPDVAAPRRVRLGVPRGSFLFDDLDDEVARATEAALSRLSAAGFELVDTEIPALDGVREWQAHGGLSPPEAYHWHRALLKARHAEYDPRVARRIEGGMGVSAADYLDLVAARRRLIADATTSLEGIDAWLAPTLPCLPPAIAPLEADDEAYRVANLRMLRNTAPVNVLDGCALTVPLGPEGGPPVGLMISGAPASDRRVLSIGLAVEAALVR